MYKPSVYLIKVQEAKEKTTVFHAKTGALLRIPNAAYSVLQQAEFDALSSKGYLRLLQKHLLCMPRSVQETDEFLLAAQGLLTSDHPHYLSFTIAVTTRCNLSCPYCFERGVRREDMSLDTAHAVADYILGAMEAAPGLRMVELKWFGGEPLLAMPAIKQIADRVAERCLQNKVGLKTRMITNGILLSDEIVETLLCYNLKSLHISMDGELEAYCRGKNATPQNYRDVLRAIHDYCDRANINIRLNCHKGNLPSILKLVEALHQDEKIREHVYLYLAQIITDAEGISTLAQSEFTQAHLAFLQHLYELGWHVQIKNALPMSLPTPCGNLHKHNYAIDSNGNLYHCEEMVGQTEKRVGSVFDPEHIAAVDLPESLGLLETCKTCSYLPICFNGCPQRNGKDCASMQKEALEILRLIDLVSS